MLHWMDDPEVGRVCLPCSPLRFGDALVPGLKPTPFTNQHQEEVLGGIFWFSADERAALREVGTAGLGGIRARIVRRGCQRCCSRRSGLMALARWL